MILTYGQRLFARRHLIGKPHSAYVVNNDDDFLVKMSEKFPYTPGDPHFFVHADRLNKNWRGEREGLQMKIF